MAIYYSKGAPIGDTILAFKKLASDEANTYVVAAARKSAELILEREKQLLASNGSVKTGALYRSLQIKQVRMRAKKYSRIIIDQPVFTIGPKYVGKGGNRGGVKGVNYGHLVELGHKTKSGGHIPAKPFMRPAADMSKAEVARLVIDSMNEALAEFGR